MGEFASQHDEQERSQNGLRRGFTKFALGPKLSYVGHEESRHIEAYIVRSTFSLLESLHWPFPSPAQHSLTHRKNGDIVALSLPRY